jgi:hypothetical protein
MPTRAEHRAHVVQAATEALAGDHLTPAARRVLQARVDHPDADLNALAEVLGFANGTVVSYSIRVALNVGSLNAYGGPGATVSGRLAAGPATAEPLPGRPADHRVTIAHIGAATLAAIGAGGVDRIVHDDPNGFLRFKLGVRNRYLDVVLAADDTYTVRRLRYVARQAAHLEEERVSGVCAEQLAETVRRLGDTWAGRS